jgi:DNA-binding NarL/FixJ family response regulator
MDGKPMRVFLVDDSSVVIERLEDLLGEVPGLEVLGSAGEVLKATESILQLRPDFVVLDLHLHDGPGLEVLKAVKTIRPQTIFLVCTSFSYPQYRERCFLEGASFFLDKSTEFEKLPEILSTLIKTAAEGDRETHACKI